METSCPFRRNSDRYRQQDSGFSLVEIMVVLLVIAILLAIAIPNLFSVTKSANYGTVQSNLNTALLNAKTKFLDNNQAYPASATLVTALKSAEPTLQFQTGTSIDQNHVSIFVTADSAAVVLAAFSVKTNNCWVAVDTPKQTAVAAPFAATQAPAVAANTPLGPLATQANAAFARAQLGPTYVEIKTTTSAKCIASQPVAPVGSTYQYSYTAFPNI